MFKKYRTALVLAGSAASLATDGAQLMRRGAEGEAHERCQIKLVLRDSGRRGETKPLQEGGEEEKELHSGQTLSQTYPAA